MRTGKVFSTKVLVGGAGQTLCFWEERGDLVLSFIGTFSNRGERFPSDREHFAHIQGHGSNF